VRPPRPIGLAASNYTYVGVRDFGIPGDHSSRSLIDGPRGFDDVYAAPGSYDQTQTTLGPDPRTPLLKATHRV